MRKLSMIPYFDIQLFAEGDGGTGAGDAGAGSAAPAQPQTGEKNPLASVQYGKQAGAPDAGEPQGNDDRSARFEAMIKGEFKDLYGQKVRDAVLTRLKSNEETVNRYNQVTPLLQMLGDKYGVDSADPQALIHALEEDESFYEKEAQETGMSIQQLKEVRRMQRENAQLREQMDHLESQKKSAEILAGWNQEAEKVKAVYPSFDFETELQNEQFRNLLTSHVPMQTAFEVIHKDEIIPAAMQYTAKQVEQKMAKSILAGQKRPSEGALGSQSPVQIKSDVSQLTKADRDEIERRVARGERISF